MAAILNVEHKDNFEKYLLKKLFLNNQISFENFKNNLLRNKGIISGGSLVKAIVDPNNDSYFWYNQDIDIEDYYNRPLTIASIAKTTGYKSLIIPLFKLYDYFTDFELSNKEYVTKMQSKIINYSKNELYQAINNEYKTNKQNIFDTYKKFNCYAHNICSYKQFVNKQFLLYKADSCNTQSAYNLYKEGPDLYKAYKNNLYERENQKIINFVEMILN